MVDEKKPEDDGYTFSELDDLNLHPHDSPFDEEPVEPPSENAAPSKSQAVNVRRNAFIAIAIVALLMIGYKFIEAFLQRKHVPSVKSQQSPLVATTPAPRTPVRVETPPPQHASSRPVERPVTTTVVADNTPVLQQLATVENQQQALRSSVDTLHTALSGINSHETELAEKIGQLTQTLSALASRLDEQTVQIERLLERARPPKRIQACVPKEPLPVYSIQAVIPGRAWLISENGATLTVNVGTSLRGYGIIKLIDAKQGRVYTSSGRIIRFVQ